MKITTIGAGSVVWGPTINTDFLLNPALDGAELALMDINAETVGLVKRYLDRLIAERGFTKTITVTTDLAEALRDADYVLTAISVGGDHLWRYDAIFPQVYGIFQPVGDTVGPGGLMRALRHTAPLVRIAQTMREVSTPGAPLIQLTNPMNPLCGALERLDGVPIYGVCHGVNDTEWIVAKQLGVPWDQVHIKAAGNNHNIFCTEVRVGDHSYTQDMFDELAPLVFDTPFRAEVYRRYDGLVGNFSRHPIEFLPDFLTPESRYGQTWGVQPIPDEINPIHGKRQESARAVLEMALAQREPLAWRADRDYHSLALNMMGRPEVGHTREILDDFIAALEHHDDFFIHLNVANHGAIIGVDDAYNVEIPVEFKKGVLTRQVVRFNDVITQELDRVGKEQHLLARACIEGDEEALVEALTMDTLVPSWDVAARLIREMRAFEDAYIQ